MHNDPDVDTFQSYTVKLERQTQGGSMDIYITICFDRMRLDNIGIKVGKYGSDLASFIGGWCGAVNVALKHAVPWDEISESAKVNQGKTLLHEVVEEIDRIRDLRHERLEQHRQIDLTPSSDCGTMADSGK